MYGRNLLHLLLISAGVTTFFLKPEERISVVIEA